MVLVGAASLLGCLIQRRVVLEVLESLSSRLGEGLERSAQSVLGVF